jgi:hypothetical protein
VRTVTCAIALTANSNTATGTIMVLGFLTRAPPVFRANTAVYIGRLLSNLAAYRVEDRIGMGLAFDWVLTVTGFLCFG